MSSIYRSWIALVALTSLLVSSVASIASEFPSHLVTRCAAGNTTCLRDTIQTLFEKYSAGLPELGLKPLEPLWLGDVTINQGKGGGPVAVNVHMTDAKLLGLARTQVRRVVGFGKDPRQTTFRIDTTVPVEHVLGQYTINGQVLLLPIGGHGSANITFTDVQNNITLHTKVVESSGQEYLQVVSVTSQTDCKKMYIQLDNLMNDELISQSVNAMLNENSHMLIAEMGKSISKAFNRPMLELTAPILGAFPYKDLFAED